MRPRVALVSARAARHLDEDLPPLIAALEAAGADTTVADWDDPEIDWAAFRLALLRSAWDYPQRLAEFLAWADRTAKLTALVNPPAVIRWNTDKHYLRDLARAGVPVVPTRFVEPGEHAARALDGFLREERAAEWVVKPAVGAGAQDAARYARGEQQVASGHIERLLGAGRSVLLQPYLAQVDLHGETALIYLGGRFSHAVRKGPLLRRGAEQNPALFAEEHITTRTPAAVELEVAECAVAALPFATPLYARVDLIRSGDGRPCLVELELTEPSLYFAQAPDAAGRLAAQLCDQLTRCRQEPR
ncbi:MAG: ATP-grasp domain-containing protein [Steroidobacteraceae bacterium]